MVCLHQHEARTSAFPQMQTRLGFVLVSRLISLFPACRFGAAESPGGRNPAAGPNPVQSADAPLVEIASAEKTHVKQVTNTSLGSGHERSGAGSAAEWMSSGVGGIRGDRRLERRPVSSRRGQHAASISRGQRLERRSFRTEPRPSGSGSSGTSLCLFRLFAVAPSSAPLPTRGLSIPPLPYSRGSAEMHLSIPADGVVAFHRCVI